VLTGMGVDGRDGAKAVKAHGGIVYSQDAATATIYGMPAAVAEAGLSDKVLPLYEMAAAVARWCGSDAQSTGDPGSDNLSAIDRPAIAS
jgi:chemotaxis response regulator CheB